VHLLYADDCLLVPRASIEEVEVIANILDKYYAMSGQKLNRAKSQFFLSTEVHIRHRHFIKRVLLMEEHVCLLNT